MKTAVAFKFAVYKDQAVGANRGKIVEVGDTVTLAVRNAGGPATNVDVVVTAVGNGGKDIQWDSSTTNNIRSEDIIRVGAEHQYQCPGPLNYQAVITEIGGGAAPIVVTSIALNGVTYPVGISEGAGVAGIDPVFVTALLAKLNGITGIEGYWTGVVAGTAGTQTLTLKAGNLTYVWTAITMGTGATAGAISIVP